MSLRFELKKLICQPLFLLLCLVSLTLTWQVNKDLTSRQTSYIKRTQSQLHELSSLVNDLQDHEREDIKTRARGAASDLVLIDSLLTEREFQDIPVLRQRLYKDLDYLMATIPQFFESRPVIDRYQLRQWTKWNKWLLDHQLADGPAKEGWSPGRQLQNLTESYFHPLTLLLAIGYLLISQYQERRLGYLTWKRTQVASPLAIEGKRLLARVLALSILTSLSLAFWGVTILKSGTLTKTLWLEPIALNYGQDLIPLWTYLLLLWLGGLLLLLTFSLSFIILDHLIRRDWLYLTLSLALTLSLISQSQVTSTFLGQWLSVINLPTYLASHDLPASRVRLGLILIGLDALALIMIVLFNRVLPDLKDSQHQELTPRHLTRPAAFEGLKLLRRDDLKTLTQAVLLISSLFTLTTWLEKEGIITEERERVSMQYDFYKWLPTTYPKTLIDFSKEELDAKVAWHVKQKAVGYGKSRAYLLGNDQILPAYLAFLDWEEGNLNSSQDMLDRGDGAHELTQANLNRLKVRNQISHYYWQSLPADAQPPFRGHQYVLPELEDQFRLTHQSMTAEYEEAKDWFKPTDKTGIGSLRSLFDGPFIWVCLAVSLALAWQGKGAASEDGQANLYQTQPLGFTPFLRQQWLLGLAKANGFTLSLILATFLGNSLLHGMGNLAGGFLWLNTQGQGLQVLDVLPTPTWVAFISNGHYLLVMTLVLLMLQSLLLTLGHYLQTLVPKHLLTYLLVLGLFAFLLYQVSPDFQGQTFFKALWQLLAPSS